MSFENLFYFSASLSIILITTGVIFIGYKLWKITKAVDELLMLLKQKVNKFSMFKELAYAGSFGLGAKLIAKLFKRR